MTGLVRNQSLRSHRAHRNARDHRHHRDRRSCPARFTAIINMTSRSHLSIGLNTTANESSARNSFFILIFAVIIYFYNMYYRPNEDDHGLAHDPFKACGHLHLLTPGTDYTQGLRCSTGYWMDIYRIEGWPSKPCTIQPVHQLDL